MNKLLLIIFITIVYPSIRSDWTDIDVMLDEALSLSAYITYAINPYLPLTDIYWTHNGSSTEHRLNVSDHILPTFEVPLNSTLYIKSISPDDAGLYTVTAANSAGSHTYNFSINVIYNVNTIGKSHTTL